MEKARTHYRVANGTSNAYADLQGGWAGEAAQALGATVGSKLFSDYANATALANEVYARWSNHEMATVGFGAVAPAARASPRTPTRWSRSSGTAPAWSRASPCGTRGLDGVSNPNDTNPNDGLVTVTPAQLFASQGDVTWGRVA